MKKLVVLFSLLICFHFVHSQEVKSVPENVKGRFIFLFPQAQNSVKHPVKWEKVKANYKGSLTILNAPAFALIDSTGNVLRVEMSVVEDSLPEKVKAYLKSNFKDSKIKSITRITNEKGKVTYNTVLESKPVFAEDGTLIRTEK